MRRSQTSGSDTANDRALVADSVYPEPGRIAGRAQPGGGAVSHTIPREYAREITNFSRPDYSNRSTSAGDTLLAPRAAGSMLSMVAMKARTATTSIGFQSMTNMKSMDSSASM